MKIKVNYREFEGDIYLIPTTRIEKFDELVQRWYDEDSWSEAQDEIGDEINSYFGQYETVVDEIQLWIDSKDK